MKKLSLYQVDSFTDSLFSGNPAAVVPLEQWPEDKLLQAIALENNLSETAFFVKDNNGDYEIRWFTPTVEVDLCGHATLAAAAVIMEKIAPTQQKIRFYSRHSGELAVTHDETGLYWLDFPTRFPVACDIAPSEWGAAEALDAGRDLILRLANPEAVQQYQPNLEKMSSLSWDGVLITAAVAKAEKDKFSHADFVSRCFFPKLGVLEDPVTGSAHTSLSPYWAEKLQKSSLKALQVSPRGGYLMLEQKTTRTLIGGRAVFYLTGEIRAC
ncbi:MAG: PhzF family phenazine biosynthesis protein [Alphaproteobacteria bacterium]